MARLPLCGSHSVSKDAMFQQASRSKNATLLETMQKMEKEKPDEFVQHLDDFSTTCQS